MKRGAKEAIRGNGVTERLHHLIEKLLGQLWHGSRLRTNVGTHLNGELMGLLQRHPCENGGSEGAGKAVAGSHRVGHFHLRCGLKTLYSGCKDIAAISAAGEHKHLEVILAEDEIALVLNVKTGIAKETSDSDELLIVDLQDIASFEALPDDLLGVEVLPQIDVENLQTTLGGGVEKAMDGVARRLIALGQRADPMPRFAGCRKWVHPLRQAPPARCPWENRRGA